MCKLQALIPLLACAVVVSAKDFGYGYLQNGPEHWADNFKRCSGKYQSPIDINELEVERRQFPDLEYVNFDVKPKTVNLANNGHTVLVTMTFDKGKEPRLRGGPLERDDYYQFEQFHFHWGENDTVGSEDLLNNHRFPAELHVVMRSLEFPDFKSALGKDHGIAVLAYFFRIDRMDNYDYGEFVEMLKIINRKGKSSDLAQPLPLKQLISQNRVSYYAYVGSLTTPPCEEKVTWIEYSEPIPISEYQINRFRQLTANDDHLKNNFRPTQPLNERIVYENLPRNPDWDSPNTGAVGPSVWGGVVVSLLLGCRLLFVPLLFSGF